MTDKLTPVHCGCGGEAVLETDHDTIQPVAPIDWKRVRCNKCNIRTTWRRSEALAIEAWNMAMSAKDINVPNKERTAKVESDGNFIRSEKMTNLISKSMTIEAVLDLLKQMPEIEPEERTAKVEISDGWFRCCGCDYCTEHYSYDWKYCPNCGCRLEWK